MNGILSRRNIQGHRLLRQSRGIIEIVSTLQGELRKRVERGARHLAGRAAENYQFCGRTADGCDASSGTRNVGGSDSGGELDLCRISRRVRHIVIERGRLSDAAAGIRYS